MEELLLRFKELDETILKSSKIEKIEKVQKKLFLLQGDVLRMKLSLEDNALFDQPELEDKIKEVNRLLDNIKTALAIIKDINLSHQTKNLRRLSQITTICLPLGLITGFFGMNFAFMGIDPGSKGILRAKNAALYFWTLVFVVTIIVNLMFSLHVF